MSFIFPFFAFLFDWGNSVRFPGHGSDRAHNYVPALTTRHRLPVPRCRLWSVLVGLSQLGWHQGEAGKEWCVCSPLATPTSPKFPTSASTTGVWAVCRNVRDQDLAGRNWTAGAKNFPALHAHLPPLPWGGWQRGACTCDGDNLGTVLVMVVSKHPPIAWLWSGSHHSP